MKLSSVCVGLAAAALTGMALPALAATVVIDFDSIANNAHVNQFYNGGLDSLGGSGPNFGIDFSAFVTATSLSAPTSPPRYVYVTKPTGIVNVAAGFTGFSFAYGTLAPATLSVFSGLNGTGTLLGNQVVNGNSSAFGSSAVTFSGVGRSVTLASMPNYAGVDDLRFEMAQPVPEPGSWAMLLAGFGVLGILARRRTR
ncbi:MAG: PEPxxWA-CTERM sorting domain-containing protein [Telluria sp.]|nr:PEPxxWA-CTERM sorting domain-containing protein [Telluria sp.]